HVGAVPAAVVGRAAVDQVDAGDGAAGEVDVGDADAGVDHAGIDARTGGDVVVAAVEGAAALIDAVETPRRVRLRRPQGDLGLDGEDPGQGQPADGQTRGQGDHRAVDGLGEDLLHPATQRDEQLREQAGDVADRRVDLHDEASGPR